MTRSTAGPYSIVNIAAVVRDLSRLPTGAVLALDLARALSLGARDLAVLDRLPVVDAAPERRRRALAVAETSPHAHDLLAATTAAATEAGLAAWSRALPQLEAATLGGAADLIRWLRHEVLAGCWERRAEVAVARWPHALDVVADAALSGWAQAEPALARPWRGWSAQQPPVAVDDEALASVVNAIETADVSALAAAGAAMRAARAGGWSWALAMHDACWALELTGRGRLAAVAQLLALRSALTLAGPALLSADVVTAVTAAIHATAAADMLPGDTVSSMCRPLLSRL